MQNTSQNTSQNTDQMNGQMNGQTNGQTNGQSIDQSTNQSTTNYYYIYSLLAFIAWCIFGFKVLLIGYTGYNAYKYGQKSLWINFVILTSSLLFGWLSTLFTLFMVALYEFILNSDSYMQKIKMGSDFINNLIQSVDNSTNPQIPEKYRNYINYYKRINGVYRTSCEVIITVYDIGKDMTKTYIEKYNIQYYIDLINKYLKLIVDYIYWIVISIPIIGDRMEMFINSILVQFKNIVTNADSYMLSSPASSNPIGQSEQSISTDNKSDFNNLPSNLEVSNCKLPNFELPSFELPNFELPNFQLPNFKNLPPNFNLPPPNSQDLEGIKNMLSQISNLNDSLNKMQQSANGRNKTKPTGSILKK
ncbi:MAG: hypothetical protein Homavirus15_3 [Homavirus sp.]|uniref:Transmembrane protein n=1 Tax=Homavirus sp. TaxID=2487769 RepID=A0A3G5A6T2_9VIRU|nr:MAG: hypothetical protein Homavirus15_3 [Homavirus sp.]